MTAGVTEIRGAITGVSNANPGVVTSTAHGLSNGQQVSITQVGGLENFNNTIYRVNSVTTDTFALQNAATRENFDTTDLETYTSGGRWNRVDRVNASRIFYNP